MSGTLTKITRSLLKFEPVGSLCRIRKGEQRHEEGYHSRRRLSRRGWCGRECRRKSLRPRLHVKSETRLRLRYWPAHGLLPRMTSNDPLRYIPVIGLISMTSMDDCGISKCGWFSKDFAAASCDSASTNEYNIISFLVSEVPLDETRLVLPPTPVSVIIF